VNILVTGANGFVGRILCAELFKQGFSIKTAVRSRNIQINNFEPVVTGSIDSNTDWSVALRDVDVVIHLAARTHVTTERSANPIAEFRRVNVDGTRHLAESAVKAGVKKIVYVSSVKVNGERTTSSFTELEEPKPQDAYGVSKWEAEQALHKVSAETKMEIVILRPPLVYGAGVKGNFAQMIKVLAKRIPLPFSSVKNLRSLIYVENLVDALILCATHPNAAGQTYLVSDGQDVSTPDLLRKLSSAMKKPVKLLPCSPIFMGFAGRLIGKSNQIERLLSNLQVDSSKIRRELAWQPPFSLDEGLKATGEAYR
jgi:nucleoside-diphosphate-sugar epimerase